MSERRLPAHSDRQRGRFFFGGMATAAILTVFVGFAPTYYLKGHFRRWSI